MKRMARYLASTMDVKPELDPAKEEWLSSFTVKAYSDNDWAKNGRDRKSTAGGAIFVYDAPVLAFSRTQPCIALSSTKAELHALRVRRFCHGGPMALACCYWRISASPRALMLIVMQLQPLQW